MGIRNDELVQRLISVDSKSCLADVVTTCRSYEAAKCATSAIRAPPDELRAISAYKKGERNQEQRKAAPPKPSSTTATFCKRCVRQHGPNACPASQSSCSSCGQQSHWARTVQCPTNNTQCHHCGRVGQYNKCCKTKMKDGHQRGSSRNSNVSQNNGKPKDKKTSSCRHLGCTVPTATKTPQPIKVLVSYGEATSHLLMLPGTKADVTS